MLVRRPLLATAIACAITVPLVQGARMASAYDEVLTHRWITWQAIEHLVRTYPGQYDALIDYRDAVLDGAQDEDDLFLDGDGDGSTLRLMRHFFRPTDSAGLVYGDRQFENSYDWGGTANDINIWDYQDALAYYRNGDPDRAYYAIGHVVHLIQDATVPAHTHLDDHGPPTGDDYEGYCTSQTRGDTDGDLPLPPADAAIPAFTSTRDAWRKTATASYWRNMVPGRLSHVDDNQASGILAQMFPDIRVGLSNEWEIPGVGKLDAAFFEHEEGYFYFPELSMAAALEREGFDPANPYDFSYADNSQQRPMVEAMARDLVPVAVLHSAATLKLFMDDIADISLPEMGSPEASGCSTAGTTRGSALTSLALALFLLGRPRKS